MPPRVGRSARLLEPHVLKYALSRRVFCGENRGGGEARMGGFAAKFRGFWVARGRGAAIQRTADADGLTGRKIF